MEKDFTKIQTKNTNNKNLGRYIESMLYDITYFKENGIKTKKDLKAANLILKNNKADIKRIQADNKILDSLIKKYNKHK